LRPLFLYEEGGYIVYANSEIIADENKSKPETRLVVPSSLPLQGKFFFREDPPLELSEFGQGILHLTIAPRIR
jgi:hypothetical protein